MYEQIRTGKIADLIKSITDFNKDPILVNQERFITNIEKYRKGLGIKPESLNTLSKYSILELQQLATYLIKLTYGSVGVMKTGKNGDILDMTPALKKNLQKSFDAERVLTKKSSAPESVIAAMTASETPTGQLPRKSLSQIFTDSKFA